MKCVPIGCVIRSPVVMEAHPIIVIIRALRMHLPRYHDNDDATTAALRRHHVVTIYARRSDSMRTV